MDTRTLNSKRYRLLDVGGTYIKCDDGRQIPAMSGGNKGEIATALRKAIGPYAGLAGIGVAIPGPFDYREGIFRMKHKFAAAYGESFRSLAAVPGQIELKFIHDVNVLLKGAIKVLGLEQSNTALVTLGTGLGFSYAVRGEIQTDSGGSPALSLWNVPTPGGILEDELSARGITGAFEAKTGEKGRSAYSIARMAYAGNESAIEVYSAVGEKLGQALQELLEQLKIDILLVGGQISASLSLMSEPLRNALEGIRILQTPPGSVFEGLANLFDNNNQQ